MIIVERFTSGGSEEVAVLNVYISEVMVLESCPVDVTLKKYVVCGLRLPIETRW